MLNVHVVDTSKVDWYPLPASFGQKVKLVLDSNQTGGPEGTYSFRPNGHSAPHYHYTAQYQVVMQGKATFPRHELPAVSVHYTDHQVPYGPFTCSGDYHHFVLHATPGGQISMSDPEARKRINRQGRERYGTIGESGWGPRSKADGVRQQVLFQEASGVGAEAFELAPGAELAITASEYGRYEIVTRGSVMVSGTELGRLGLRFVSGNGEPAPVRAGPEGATLLVLHYDQDATGRHGGDMTRHLVRSIEQAKARQTCAMAYDQPTLKQEVP